MTAEPTAETADQPKLREISGPSALAGGWRRFAYLSVMLAWTDFKLRFFGSILGYFWQLVRPLALFGVLLFVFTKIVKIGEVVPFYPVVLIMNIVLFTWFAEGTGGAVTSLVDREAVVRKIHFPRMAVPVSVVMTASLNLLFNGLVVLAFAFAFGIDPRADWLQVPFLIGALGFFTAGMAMLLSALFVRFRDVKPIWDVVLQILFYASPVIYALETVDIPADLRQAMMLNPIAAILQQMRHALIDPDAPTAAAMAGGYAPLLVPLTIVLVLSVLGYWVFNREAPRVAEEL